MLFYYILFYYIILYYIILYIYSIIILYHIILYYINIYIYIVLCIYIYIMSNIMKNFPMFLWQIAQLRSDPRHDQGWHSARSRRQVRWSPLDLGPKLQILSGNIIG